MSAMPLVDVLSIVSLVVGLVSIVLAVVAMWLSKNSERESRENLNQARQVLSEVDKKAAVIQSTVAESQKELQSTLTTLLTKTLIPEKNDMGEQFAMMFMQKLMSDPESAAQLMQGLQPFIDASEKNKT